MFVMGGGVNSLRCYISVAIGLLTDIIFSDAALCTLAAAMFASGIAIQTVTGSNSRTVKADAFSSSGTVNTAAVHTARRTM